MDFTIPTDRGDLVGVDVIVQSNTFADIAGGIFNLFANGISILENDSILQYSTFYQDKETFTPVLVQEGSKLTGTLSGILNNDTVIQLILYFNGNRIEELAFRGERVREVCSMPRSYWDKHAEAIAQEMMLSQGRMS